MYFHFLKIWFLYRNLMLIGLVWRLENDVSVFLINVILLLVLEFFWMIYINWNFFASLCVHQNIGIKHSITNENFIYLWHKRLDHVSKERLQRLVKNEIIPNLDFTNLGLHMHCIKGKQTKHNKKGATRSSQLLEIHTNTCGPFDISYFGGKKYFFTSIDDFLHFRC